MPFTFFAHQLFALPFKVAWPKKVDGTAICLGSMAPDLAYALEGTPLALSTHSFAAQLYWTAPVAWLLTRLVRRTLALPLGAQLAAPLGPEVRALAHNQHTTAVTLGSGVVGGVTHILVDAFTHPAGWAWERFAILRRHLMADLSVADALQNLGHTVGTAVGIWWLYRLIRGRAISRWASGSADAHAQGISEQGVSSTRARASALSALPPLPVQPFFWRNLTLGIAIAGLGALMDLYLTRSLPIAIIRGSLYGLASLTLVALQIRHAAAARERQPRDPSVSA